MPDKDDKRQKRKSVSGNPADSVRIDTPIIPNSRGPSNSLPRSKSAKIKMEELIQNRDRGKKSSKKKEIRAVAEVANVGTGIANLANIVPGVNAPSLETLEEGMDALMAFVNSEEESEEAYKHQQKRMQNMATAFEEFIEGGLDTASAFSNTPILGHIASAIAVLPKEKKYDAAKLLLSIAEKRYKDPVFLLHSYLSDIKTIMTNISAAEKRINEINKEIDEHAGNIFVYREELKELKDRCHKNSLQLGTLKEHAKAVAYGRFSTLKKTENGQRALNLAKNILEIADKKTGGKDSAPFMNTREDFNAHAHNYDSIIRDINQLNKQNFHKAKEMHNVARDNAYGTRAHLASIPLHFIGLGAFANAAGVYYGTKGFGKEIIGKHENESLVTKARAYQLEKFFEDPAVSSMLPKAKIFGKIYDLDDEDVRKLCVILDEAHRDGGEINDSIRILKRHFGLMKTAKERSDFINSIYKPISEKRAIDELKKLYLMSGKEKQFESMSESQLNDLAQINLIAHYQHYLELGEISPKGIFDRAIDSFRHFSGKKENHSKAESNPSNLPLMSKKDPINPTTLPVKGERIRAKDDQSLEQLSKLPERITDAQYTHSIDQQHSLTSSNSHQSSYSSDPLSIDIEKIQSIAEKYDLSDTAKQQLIKLVREFDTDDRRRLFNRLDMVETLEERIDFIQRTYNDVFYPEDLVAPAASPVQKQSHHQGVPSLSGSSQAGSSLSRNRYGIFITHPHDEHKKAESPKYPGPKGPGHKEG